MAWTSPPTFADGNILTANQLNILSDDIEYLYGLGDVLNVPFCSKRYEGSSPFQNVARWRIRKKYRYLHYSFTLSAGYINPDFRLYYDVNKIFEITSPSTLSTLQTWSGYVDLNGLSLTTGTWYLIYWYGDPSSNNSSIANYLIESSGTTL